MLRLDRYCMFSAVWAKTPYFRARQRFFRFELPSVRDDVDYLRRRYFDNVAVTNLAVSLHTRQRHVDTILGLFRYRLCALEEGVDPTFVTPAAI